MVSGNLFAITKNTNNCGHLHCSTFVWEFHNRGGVKLRGYCAQFHNKSSPVYYGRMELTGAPVWCRARVGLLVSAICHQSVLSAALFNARSAPRAPPPQPQHYLHWKTVWTESIYFANYVFHSLYSFDFLRGQGERLGELFDCSITYAVRRSGQHLRAIKVLAGLVEQVPSTFNLNSVLFQFKNSSLLFVKIVFDWQVLTLMITSLKL